MTRQALTILALACFAGQAIAQDAPSDTPDVQPLATETEAASAAPVAETQSVEAAGDAIAEIPVEPTTDQLPAAVPTPASAQPTVPGYSGSEQDPGPLDSSLDIEAGSPLARALGEQRPAPGMRLAAHERLVALLGEQRYAEAEEAALDVVTLTQREFGNTAIEVAAPLDNLATTQMLGGKLIEAEQNYMRAIEVIKLNEGQLSARLINAYVGLGSTYNRGGLYEKSEEAFSTALRLNHVNEGFTNDGQMKIRDGLTETYVGMQKLEKANFQQVVQLEIYQRRLGVNNPETAPAMYKLARWYERSGQPEEARYMYQRAQAIIRKSYGRKSIEMAAAYEGLSSNYERQGDVATSASFLKKALEIVEAQEDIDRPRQADLLIRLGELYGKTGRYSTANAFYERGWQALSQDEEYDALREELFDQPVRVTGVSWNNLRYASGSSCDGELLSEGFVLLRYRVDERGLVKDVVIVESEPSGVMDRQVSDALRRSYFRPRMADGVAVVSDIRLYRHDFRYEPENPGRSEDAGKPLEPPTDSGRLEYPGSSDG
jgi:TonB family protein